MDQIQAASKMAGEWWAERLSVAYDERRAAFKEAVTKRVEQALRKECYWDWSGEKVDGVHPFQPKMVETEFDYDPHFCLCEALKESIPGMSAMDLKKCLPTKHTLEVYAELLVPKEGYGNWTAKIPVPPVVTPNV